MDEKQIYHREKMSRSRIPNAHGRIMPNSRSIVAPSSVKRFMVMPSWGCIAILRVVARSVLMLMALAIFPFFLHWAGGMFEFDMSRLFETSLAGEEAKYTTQNYLLDEAVCLVS